MDAADVRVVSSRDGRGGLVVWTGIPLVDVYLEFLGGRCRPNGAVNSGANDASSLISEGRTGSARSGSIGGNPVSAAVLKHRRCSLSHILICCILQVLQLTRRAARRLTSRPGH